MRIKLSIGMASGAQFSGDMKYRIGLWRAWDLSLPRILFVMLNPSTADANANDPSVERCQRRAIRLGFGSLFVCNIFAWRSTDPMELYKVKRPIGEGNDFEISRYCFKSDLVVCAWGIHGNLKGRGKRVLDLIRSQKKIPHALKINKDGTPAHPLYLPYSLKPIRME